MQLGMILETNDAERIWNALCLATTALDAGHTVVVFLLGDGVEAPDVETEKFNPPGLIRKFLQAGGELQACGTCLDARDLKEDGLRPRSTMRGLLEVIETADQTITVG